MYLAQTRLILHNRIQYKDTVILLLIIGFSENYDQNIEAVRSPATSKYFNFSEQLIILSPSRPW